MKNPLTQLGFAIAVLVIAGIAYGVWYGIVADASANDAALAGTIGDESDAAARAAAAERTLASLTPDEAAIDAHFVATSDIVSFLQDLQATGSALGSAVTVGSVSEEDAPQPHLVLAVTVTGSFNAVMSTLASIEYGPYDVTTTQGALNVDPNDSSATTTQWNAALTFSVGTRASTSSPAASSSASMQPAISTTPRSQTPSASPASASTQSAPSSTGKPSPSI